MKINLFFILIILFFSSLLFAQNDEDIPIIKFGISATLEKSSEVYTDGYHRYTDIGFSKIMFPVIIKSLIKIQPEFSYRSYNSKKSWDYRLWQFGLGIFYFVQYNDIHFYLGPRYGFEKLKSTLWSTEDEKSISTFHNYGVTLGSEYFLSKNFSIGGEFRINKYIFNDAEEFDIDLSHLSLIPVLYLSFYIK